MIVNKKINLTSIIKRRVTKFVHMLKLSLFLLFRIMYVDGSQAVCYFK